MRYSIKLRQMLALASLTCAFVLSSYGIVFDDEEPEITDRVARISSIDGDVQLKRLEIEDWEKAVLNLPLIEGDTLSVGIGARVEIQLDNTNYIRVSENSVLTLSTLKEEGIAVSLLQGTAAFRINSFDGARGFFEIDAPRSTIAVQRQGLYLVDAGSGADEVGVSVFDDGEARVYSETSGFTLRGGRRATLFIAGANNGEWDLGDASANGFAILDWSSERDEVIARQSRDSYVDKYYDRDIYGADELKDYGDWVYEPDYGYVWSPHTRSIAYYDQWSPYRYGHWRWLPTYGWTWVNDEAWGWATYHYGRWIYFKGRWFWSPYGYYRTARNWWRPALVYLTIFNNNVCWYPLPYHYAYYNYNWHHTRQWTKKGRGKGGSGPVAGVPTPTPSPVISQVKSNRTRGNMPPLSTVPASAVVGIPVDQFGQKTLVRSVGSQATAKEILTKPIGDQSTPPILPTVQSVKTRPDSTIYSIKPAPMPVVPVKTGAAVREPDSSLDKKLQRSTIFGNRPPVRSAPSETPAITPPNTTVRSGSTPRSGAVERPTTRPVVPITPRSDDGGGTRTSRPITGDNIPPPPSTSRQTERPRYEPPTRTQPAPRSDPPRQRESPRYDPPVRSQPAPKADPPATKSQPAPKADPPKQSDPPASRNEPRKP